MAAPPAISSREQHLRSVGRLYGEVVGDLVDSFRQLMRDEGLDGDDEMLHELKSNWEHRIRKSGAVPYYGLDDSRTVVTVKIKRDGVSESQAPDIKVVIPRVATERHATRLKEELISLANKFRCEKISDVDAKWMIEERLEAIFGSAPVAQVDGTNDDSSDDSDTSDSDADGPEAKRAKTNGTVEEAPASEESSSSSSEDEKPEEDEDDDEPPLCSDDDLSDMDPELVFDATENTCVCLYRNVKEEKTKDKFRADRDSNWTLLLSNGIMNINGLDFAFQTLEGAAKWN